MGKVPRKLLGFIYPTPDPSSASAKPLLAPRGPSESELGEELLFTLLACRPPRLEEPGKLAKDMLLLLFGRSEQ